ncbi:MAG: CCA tRNA nucleotidyltransferase [Bacillus sp. (in: firmicutes)]
MNEHFQRAIPLLNKIEQHGYEAVFVGGSVRDFLLNRAIHDVDIATSATPEEIKAIFPKTVDVGIEHGTVMVLAFGESYEITTYRAESEYVDHRKPKEVKFIRSLHDDLQRRDFTMNAIAMNKNGELIDPFHGQQAIRHQLIETVGDANERFEEDALRMMRALRFVSQLSFTCSSETLKALVFNKELLATISVERITSEFGKLLDGINVQDAIRLLTETDLLAYLPELAGKHDHMLQLASYPIHELKSEDEKWALAMLCTDTLENVEKTLRKWRLSVKRIRSIRTIMKLVKELPECPNLKWLLFQNGIEYTISANRVLSVLGSAAVIEENLLRDEWHSLVIHEPSELAVKGTDLMKWAPERKSGPWISEALSSISEKVINEEIKNEKECIFEEAKRCNLI